jgi:hypothetical protein
VALHDIMQLVPADEMLDDDAGGADIDGTLGVDTCASRRFAWAKTLAGAVAPIAAANRKMAEARMSVSVNRQAGP